MRANPCILKITWTLLWGYEESRCCYDCEDVMEQIEREKRVREIERERQSGSERERAGAKERERKRESKRERERDETGANFLYCRT